MRRNKNISLSLGIVLFYIREVFTMRHTFLIISVVVLLVGIVLLATGGIIFRVRAVTNKKAWNGGTKPFILTGLIVFAIGLIGLLITYPY